MRLDLNLHNLNPFHGGGSKDMKIVMELLLQTCKELSEPNI